MPSIQMRIVVEKEYFEITVNDRRVFACDRSLLPHSEVTAGFDAMIQAVMARLVVAAEYGIYGEIFWNHPKMPPSLSLLPKIFEKRDLPMENCEMIGRKHLYAMVIKECVTHLECLNCESEADAV